MRVGLHKKHTTWKVCIFALNGQVTQKAIAEMIPAELYCTLKLIPFYTYTHKTTYTGQFS